MWSGHGNLDGGFGTVGGAGPPGGYLQSPGGFGSPAGAQAEKKQRSRSQNIVPCTVSQLLAAEQVDEAFRICDVEISQVTVVGIVRHAEKAPTNILYKVDDMTAAPMDVRQWVDTDEAGGENVVVPPGTYVKVAGHLRSFQNKKSLVAFKIMPLENMNEFTTHILEIVNAAEYVRRGQPGWAALSLSLLAAASAAAQACSWFWLRSDPPALRPAVPAKLLAALHLLQLGFLFRYGSPAPASRGPRLSRRSSFIYFLWNLFLICPRILAVALFALLWPYGVAVHFPLVWLAMFLWVSLQGTDFMESPGPEQLYRAMVAVILYFSWFNVAQGRTLHRSIIYHGFILVDSTLLVLSWLWGRAPSEEHWYLIPVVSAALPCYLLGLGLRVTYYKWLHPNMQVQQEGGSDEVDANGGTDGPEFRSFSEPDLVNRRMQCLAQSQFPLSQLGRQRFLNGAAALESAA
ncbi:replication protein A 32 kDa subunit [Empidonax traillii]|uniref:replication protein A 32 kDa subunit n=1 Tax=Empidonax traillii TaxID=164674 RepID=UPI000FFD53CD|nr:replication protein A 32 kDa subunit [Empidonax traillii]